MTDEELKQWILDSFDATQSYHSKDDYYGVFYKGKRMIISSKRIYKQAGRARAEIIGTIVWTINSKINRGAAYSSPQYTPMTTIKKTAAKICDELITHGIIEIKKV